MDFNSVVLYKNSQDQRLAKKWDYYHPYTISIDLT